MSNEQLSNRSLFDHSTKRKDGRKFCMNKFLVESLLLYLMMIEPYDRRGSSKVTVKLSEPVAIRWTLVGGSGTPVFEKKSSFDFQWKQVSVVSSKIISLLLLCSKENSRWISVLEQENIRSTVLTSRAEERNFLIDPIENETIRKGEQFNVGFYRRAEIASLKENGLFIPSSCLSFLPFLI